MGVLLLVWVEGRAQCTKLINSVIVEPFLSRALPSIRTRQQAQNGDHDGDGEVFDRIERETFKLELYRHDPLVDVRGLKR